MPASPSNPINPYAEFQAELDQIQRHKWLVSEKAGQDVGFEKALTDWARNHRADWRRERNKKATKGKS